jgi:hypothetical protein
MTSLRSVRVARSARSHPNLATTQQFVNSICRPLMNDINRAYERFNNVEMNNLNNIYENFLIHHDIFQLITELHNLDNININDKYNISILILGFLASGLHRYIQYYTNDNLFIYLYYVYCMDKISHGITQEPTNVINAIRRNITIQNINRINSIIQN